MLYVLSGVAVSQQPDAFQSLLASAQQAQARSDFQSAAQFYKKASTIHPEIAEIKANLGLMYFQIGRNEEAVQAFRQTIRLQPQLFVPNLFLGREYVKLKHFDEAIPYLKQAVLSKPTDINAQLGLAEAYAGSGNTRLAIASYVHAEQIDPQDADIWYHLGISYLEQVEDDARVLVDRHKDSPYFQVLVADNLSEQHAFIQATDAYQKALTSLKIPPGTHASYAFALLNRQDLAGAERELKAELRSNPGSLMAKLGFARLYVEQGKAEEAAEEIQEIWAIDPGFVRTNEPLFNAGLAEPKRAEIQRALEERQESNALSPQLTNLFRSGKGDPDAAWKDTSSNSEKPSSPTPDRIATAELYAEGKYQQCSDRLSSRLRSRPAGELRMLVFCAYSTGDYRDAFDAASKIALTAGAEAEGLYWETKSAQKLAVQAINRASEMDSGSPKLHVLLGDVYRERKSFSDAEREYRKALALQPEDAGALFGLSLTLLAEDRLEEAFHVAQSGLKDNSDDPELNAVMGEVLCARHDFAAAEPYLKKSLNAKPEYVPHVHALLGNVYAQTGHTEQAISELKLALADDRDGTVHYQIGRLYLKVGDRDSAKQAFDVSERLHNEALDSTSVLMPEDKDGGQSQ